MQIIGKKFTRGNDTTVYVPQNVENDFVIFESGAKCKLSTFFTDFVEVGAVTESVKTTNISNDDTPIDPEKFFEIPANEGLLNQLDNVIKNPGQHTGSSKLRDSVAAGGKEKNFKDLSEVKPVNKPIEMKESPLDLLKKNQPQNENQPVQHNQQNNTNETPNQSAPQNSRVPEWDMFDRVKKSETVILNIPIKILLPKAQRIDALNDMFETSFTSYIAKQYIQNELTGKSKSFQIEIQKQIEAWMNEQLEGNVKPSRKKKSAKKEETLEEPISTNKPIDAGISAMDLFNKNGVAPTIWNGDIASLEAIQSEEQFTAVKERMDKMKANDNTDSKEYERYQDMIIEYNVMMGR